MAKRTETSRTYRRSDGAMVTRVWQRPVNKLVAGKYQPLDPTLEPSGGGFAAKLSQTAVQLPGRGDGTVRVGDADSWMSLALQDAAPTSAEVDGSRASYPEALPGVARRLDSLTGGVKETLTLASADAASTYRYTVDLAEGLTLKSADDGFVAVDGRGRAQFVIPAPIMWDAAGDESRPSRALAYTLSGSTLTLRVDPDWLSSPARRFPVTVDPSINYYGGPTIDCTITSAAFATSNDCGSSTISAGADTVPSAHVHRAILKFDISAMPRNANVLGAQLGVWFTAQTDSSVTTNIEAHRITQAFTSAATWNKRDASNNWTTAGGTFDASIDGAFPTSNAELGGWVTYGVAPMVESWMRDPSSNLGVLLKAANESSAIRSEKTFNSAEAASNNPNIAITWLPKTGKLPDATIDSQPLTDRSALGVNVASGNLLVSNGDVKIGGVGIDLTVDRAYNSQAGGENMRIGKNWTTTTGPSVRLDRNWWDESRVLVLADGSRWRFDYYAGAVDGTGWQLKAPPTLDAKLRWNADSSFTLTFPKSCLKWDFDASGKLTKISDKNANHLDYSYNGSGNPSSITETHGETFTITDSGSAITGMSDITGRSWGYAQTSGQLTTYTDARGNGTGYRYNAAGLLDKITDPRGNEITIGYDSDPDFPKVTSITRVVNGSSQDVTTGYAYAAADATSATGPCVDGTVGGSSVDFVQKTTVTDPRGKQTIMCSDAWGRVRLTVDAKGNKSNTGFDPQNGASNRTEGFAGTGASAVNTLTYSFTGGASLGNPTQEVSGAGETTSANYYDSTYCASASPACPSYANIQYSPRSITNAAGSKQYMQYDNNGNMTNVYDEDPSGSSVNKKISLTYNARGQVTQAWLGSSAKATTYGYNSASELITITPPSGTIGASTLTSDSKHRLLSIVDGRNYKRQFTYNSNDQVTKIQVYSGGGATLVTTFDYGYDANGNQTSRVETKGAQVNTTSYSYDKLNRRLTEGFPGSRTNTYTYDKNGNIATLVDGSGTVTYGYDDINRVASITDPASATPIAYTYDDNPSSGTARKRERTFPGGLKDQLLYDQSGKLTSLKLLNGATVLRSLALTYGTSPGSTPTDLLSTATEQSGDVRHYSYDQDDQLTRFWITSGATTTYDWNVGISGGGKYDAGGNRLGLIRSSGSALRYQTNNAHQLCYQTTGATTPACSSPPAGATTFSYDLSGNQITNTAAGAAAYDELDRVQTLGGATSLGYLTPTNGELTSVGATVLQNNLMGLGRNGTTAYTRNPADGSVVAQRGTSSTEYYFADQIGSTTDLYTGTSIVRTYGYDPDGNPRGGSGSGAQTDIRYAGGHLVNNLYHYGRRYYDPTTARWTQPDPIDQASDLTQANRYAYAAGDPINNTDPSGTCIVLSCNTWSHVLGTAADVAGNVTGMYGVAKICAGSATFGPVAFAAGCSAAVVLDYATNKLIQRTPLGRGLDQSYLR